MKFNFITLSNFITFITFINEHAVLIPLMNVMNIMKFAYSVEISLHSLMNSLMRLNESNEFINELNEWLMKFIKMTFCPKKYFIEIVTVDQSGKYDYRS